jgi:membrane associated rhomboid family serine protease
VLVVGDDDEGTAAGGIKAAARQILLKPWALLTGAFIENGIVGFVTTLTMVAYMGRYVETLWGSRQFAKYLALNIVGSNLLCFMVFCSLRWWLVSDNDDKDKGDGVERVDITITGAVGLVMALIVAIKQRIPNHYLLFFNGTVRLRVSLVPFWFLVVINILSVFLPDLHVPLVLSWLSFWISWLYLRFWKEGGSGRQLSLLPMSELDDVVNSVLDINMKGDRTTQFALYTFFPYPLSILVKFITAKLFVLFVKLKITNGLDFSSDSEEDSNQESKTDDNNNNNNNNNVLTQQDLVSSMKDSKFFTSSSLAGVSSKISTFTLPSFLKFGRKKEAVAETQKNLDQRRQIALQVLNQ